MQIGIDSFAAAFDEDSRAVNPAERLPQLIEQIEHADDVGLDACGVGEHHRSEFLDSAPAVILGAAAVRTQRIRLTSAVTVLSADDPVRAFQNFATLDLLSRGSAEMIVGRGSSIEAFPLFGYRLEDYDALFEEKLDLLLAIRDGEHVNWSGAIRPPLNGQGVYPRALQEPLPVWIAVGGTPQSVALAGAFGLPVAIAIIGGEPRRFAPLLDLYRESARRADQDATRLRTSINVHGFIADTTQAAADQFYGPQSEVMNRIGRERGWGPTSRAQFDFTWSERRLFLGDPETVFIRSSHVSSRTTASWADISG